MEGESELNLQQQAIAIGIGITVPLEASYSAFQAPAKSSDHGEKEGFLLFDRIVRTFIMI